MKGGYYISFIVNKCGRTRCICLDSALDDTTIKKLLKFLKNSQWNAAMLEDKKVKSVVEFRVQV
jgi:hypothetical protein